MPRGGLASSLSFPQSGEYLDNDHKDHQNDGEDDQEDYHDDYDALGSINNSASNCVVEIQTTMNQRKHLHTGTKRATGVMGLFREF